MLFKFLRTLPQHCLLKVKEGNIGYKWCKCCKMIDEVQSNAELFIISKYLYQSGYYSYLIKVGLGRVRL